MTSPANYHEAGPDTQGDITDIDSIIEINGREIATTPTEDAGDLSMRGAVRGTTARHHRRRRRQEAPREQRRSVGPRESWTRAQTCQRARGLIYSRSARVVTNLRDRVTVRLTTARRHRRPRGGR